GVLHLLPAAQDRRGRRAPHPHQARRRLRPARPARLSPRGPASPPPDPFFVTSPARLRSAAYQRLHNMSLTQRLVAVVVLLVLAAYVITTTVSITMLRGYRVDGVDDHLDAYREPLARSTVTQLLGGSGERSELELQTFVPPNQYYVVFTPVDEDLPP